MSKKPTFHFRKPFAPKNLNITFCSNVNSDSGENFFDDDKFFNISKNSHNKVNRLDQRQDTVSFEKPNYIDHPEKILISEKLCDLHELGDAPSSNMVSGISNKKNASPLKRLMVVNNLREASTLNTKMNIDKSRGTLPFRMVENIDELRGETLPFDKLTDTSTVKKGIRLDKPIDSSILKNDINVYQPKDFLQLEIQGIKSIKSGTNKKNSFESGFEFELDKLSLNTFVDQNNLSDSNERLVISVNKSKKQSTNGDLNFLKRDLYNLNDSKHDEIDVKELGELDQINEGEIVGAVKLIESNIRLSKNEKSEVSENLVGQDVQKFELDITDSGKKMEEIDQCKVFSNKKDNEQQKASIILRKLEIDKNSNDFVGLRGKQCVPSRKTGEILKTCHFNTNNTDGELKKVDNSRKFSKVVFKNANETCNLTNIEKKTSICKKFNDRTFIHKSINNHVFSKKVEGKGLASSEIGDDDITLTYKKSFPPSANDISLDELSTEMNIGTQNKNNNDEYDELKKGAYNFESDKTMILEGLKNTNDKKGFDDLEIASNGLENHCRGESDKNMSLILDKMPKNRTKNIEKIDRISNDKELTEYVERFNDFNDDCRIKKSIDSLTVDSPLQKHTNSFKTLKGKNFDPECIISAQKEINERKKRSITNIQNLFNKRRKQSLLMVSNDAKITKTSDTDSGNASKVFQNVIEDFHFISKNHNEETCLESTSSIKYILTPYNDKNNTISKAFVDLDSNNNAKHPEKQTSNFLDEKDKVDYKVSSIPVEKTNTQYSKHIKERALTCSDKSKNTETVVSNQPINITFKYLNQFTKSESIPSHRSIISTSINQDIPEELTRPYQNQTKSSNKMHLNISKSPTLTYLVHSKGHPINHSKQNKGLNAEILEDYHETKTHDYLKHSNETCKVNSQKNRNKTFFKNSSLYSSQKLVINIHRQNGSHEDINTRVFNNLKDSNASIIHKTDQNKGNMSPLLNQSDRSTLLFTRHHKTKNLHSDLLDCFDNQGLVNNNSLKNTLETDSVSDTLKSSENHDSKTTNFNDFTLKNQSYCSIQDNNHSNNSIQTRDDSFIHYGTYENTSTPEILMIPIAEDLLAHQNSYLDEDVVFDNKNIRLASESTNNKINDVVSSSSYVDKNQQTDLYDKFHLNEVLDGSLIAVRTCNKSTSITNEHDFKETEEVLTIDGLMSIDKSVNSLNEHNLKYIKEVCLTDGSIHIDRRVNPFNKLNPKEIDEVCFNKRFETSNTNTDLIHECKAAFRQEKKISNVLVLSDKINDTTTDCLFCHEKEYNQPLNYGIRKLNNDYSNIFGSKYNKNYNHGNSIDIKQLQHKNLHNELGKTVPKENQGTSVIEIIKLHYDSMTKSISTDPNVTLTLSQETYSKSISTDKNIGGCKIDNDKNSSVYKQSFENTPVEIFDDKCGFKAKKRKIQNDEKMDTKMNREIAIKSLRDDMRKKLFSKTICPKKHLLTKSNENSESRDTKKCRGFKKTHQSLFQPGFSVKDKIHAEIMKNTPDCKNGYPGSSHGIQNFLPDIFALVQSSLGSKQKTENIAIDGLHHLKLQPKSLKSGRFNLIQKCSFNIKSTENTNLEPSSSMIRNISKNCVENTTSERTHRMSGIESLSIKKQRRSSLDFASLPEKNSNIIIKKTIQDLSKYSDDFHQTCGKQFLDKPSAKLLFLKSEDIYLRLEEEIDKNIHLVKTERPIGGYTRIMVHGNSLNPLSNKSNYEKNFKKNIKPYRNISISKYQNDENHFSEDFDHLENSKSKNRGSFLNINKIRSKLDQNRSSAHEDELFPNFQSEKEYNVTCFKKKYKDNYNTGRIVTAVNTKAIPIDAENHQNIEFPEPTPSGDFIIPSRGNAVKNRFYTLITRKLDLIEEKIDVMSDFFKNQMDFSRLNAQLNNKSYHHIPTTRRDIKNNAKKDSVHIAGDLIRIFQEISGKLSAILEILSLKIQKEHSLVCLSAKKHNIRFKKLCAGVICSIKRFENLLLEGMNSDTTKTSHSKPKKTIRTENAPVSNRLHDDNDKNMLQFQKNRIVLINSVAKYQDKYNHTSDDTLDAHKSSLKNKKNNSSKTKKFENFAISKVSGCCEVFEHSRKIIDHHNKLSIESNHEQIWNSFSKMIKGLTNIEYKHAFNYLYGVIYKMFEYNFSKIPKKHPKTFGQPVSACERKNRCWKCNLRKNFFNLILSNRFQVNESNIELNKVRKSVFRNLKRYFKTESCLNSSINRYINSHNTMIRDVFLYTIEQNYLQKFILTKVISSSILKKNFYKRDFGKMNLIIVVLKCIFLFSKYEDKNFDKHKFRGSFKNLESQSAKDHICQIIFSLKNSEMYNNQNLSISQELIFVKSVIYEAFQGTFEIDLEFLSKFLSSSWIYDKIIRLVKNIPVNIKKNNHLNRNDLQSYINILISKLSPWVFCFCCEELGHNISNKCAEYGCYKQSIEYPDYCKLLFRDNNDMNLIEKFDICNAKLSQKKKFFDILMALISQIPRLLLSTSNSNFDFFQFFNLYKNCELPSDSFRLKNKMNKICDKKYTLTTDTGRNQISNHKTKADVFKTHFLSFYERFQSDTSLYKEKLNAIRRHLSDFCEKLEADVITTIKDFKKSQADKTLIIARLGDVICNLKFENTALKSEVKNISKCLSEGENKKILMQTKLKDLQEIIEFKDDLLFRNEEEISTLKTENIKLLEAIDYKDKVIQLLARKIRGPRSINKYQYFGSGIEDESDEMIIGIEQVINPPFDDSSCGSIWNINEEKGLKRQESSKKDKLPVLHRNMESEPRLDENMVKIRRDEPVLILKPLYPHKIRFSCVNFRLTIPLNMSEQVKDSLTISDSVTHSSCNSNQFVKLREENSKLKILLEEMIKENKTLNRHPGNFYHLKHLDKFKQKTLTLLQRFSTKYKAVKKRERLLKHKLAFINHKNIYNSKKLSDRLLLANSIFRTAFSNIKAISDNLNTVIGAFNRLHRQKQTVNDKMKKIHKTK